MTNLKFSFVLPVACDAMAADFNPKRGSLPKATKAPAAPRVSKHAAIATEVRAYRATPSETDPTKPAFTHDQVGAKFGLKGSLVSAIVRNLVAVDPDYTPVFDGHRNLGPRVKPVVEAAIVADETPEAPEAPAELVAAVAAVAEAFEAAIVADETPAPDAQTETEGFPVVDAAFLATETLNSTPDEATTVESLAVALGGKSTRRTRKTGKA